MKKTLTVLMMVLLAAMLIISCDNSTSEPKTETPTTTPSEPTTKPLEKTCKVTFDVNGGNGTIPSQTVEKGKKAKKPETNPKASETYKTFAFWTADGTTEFKFDETEITADIELKATYRDYAVGDTGPAGGKIFYIADTRQTSSYVDTDGMSVTYSWKCLEAAPADLSSQYIFGYYRTSDNGANELVGTATGIGTGKSNTKALLNKMGDEAYSQSSGTDKAKYAAKACAEYSYGGYSDWFLPSQDELNKMYENKAKTGSFGDKYYWSSSEYNSDRALYQGFNNGFQGNYYRSNSYDVRPIRAF